MPIAALLIAENGPGPSVLGMPLTELQLRRANTAGATHCVILAERPGVALLESVDRLRREGFGIDIARTPADAAEFVHPEEQVLMLSPNAILAPDRLSVLANSNEPTLLCVPDDVGVPRFEHIDATARWSGFGSVDGDTLRRTVSMVGDWDLASTLLRYTVQGGARRTTMTAAEAAADLIVVDGPAAAQGAGRRLVATADVRGGGWTTQRLLVPFARFCAGLAADAGIEGRWIRTGSAVLAGLATMAALAGWIAVSLVLFIFAFFADLVSDIVIRCCAGTRDHDRVALKVGAATGGVIALAAGTTLFMRTLQWGCIVLAVVLVGAMWLAGKVRGDHRALDWQAEPVTFALVGLASVILGVPVAGLALSSIHAVISLVYGIRRSPQDLASF